MMLGVHGSHTLQTVLKTLRRPLFYWNRVMDVISDIDPATQIKAIIGLTQNGISEHVCFSSSLMNPWLKSNHFATVRSHGLIKLRLGNMHKDTLTSINNLAGYLLPNLSVDGILGSYKAMRYTARKASFPHHRHLHPPSWSVFLNCIDFYSNFSGISPRMTCDFRIGFTSCFFPQHVKCQNTKTTIRHDQTSDQSWGYCEPKGSMRKLKLCMRRCQVVSVCHRTLSAKLSRPCGGERSCWAAPIWIPWWRPTTMVRACSVLIFSRGAIFFQLDDVFVSHLLNSSKFHQVSRLEMWCQQITRCLARDVNFLSKASCSPGHNTIQVFYFNMIHVSYILWTWY